MRGAQIMGLFGVRMMSEIWVDIKGLESLYRISNTGLIASCDIPKGTAGMRSRKGRILKTSLNHAGQESVKISVSGKRMGFMISRLVASHFIRELSDSDCVFHKDLCKKNNHAANLQIMTREESCAETHRLLSSFEYVAREDMTQEIANKHFFYREGRLFHKGRTHLLVSQGDEAGYRHGNGWAVSLCGNEYTRNRIVYLMRHGYLPDYVIPKNGDNMDSRIENLFECTASQWATISNRHENLGK